MKLIKRNGKLQVYKQEDDGKWYFYSEEDKKYYFVNTSNWETLKEAKVWLETDNWDEITDFIEQDTQNIMYDVLMRVEDLPEPLFRGPQQYMNKLINNYKFKSMKQNEILVEELKEIELSCTLIIREFQKLKNKTDFPVGLC